MTIHKALYPRDGVDIPYVSIKEVGRTLASIQDSVDASIKRLDDYINKCGETLITLFTDPSARTRYGTWSIF